MKKKLVTAAALVVATLALVGCSSISSGTIHNKQANPAIWSTQCYPVGKVVTCHPIYIPASWEFDLYQSKDTHGWHQVSESTYEKYQIGDYYSEADR